MDIAGNLNYTYEEQCFLQLDRLRRELLDEEANVCNRDKWQSHRIYRNNFFVELDVRRRRRCDKLLLYTLKSLGEHLNNNLMSLSRGSRSLQTPTPVRDLSEIDTDSERSHSSSRSDSRSPSIDRVLNNISLNRSCMTLKPIREMIIISSDEEWEDLDIEDQPRIKRERFEQDENNPIEDILRFGRMRATPSIDEDPEQRPMNYPENSILLVDRKNMVNYTYDNYGVIHLKSKKHIKFSVNKSRQALMLSIISKVVKLIGTDQYMTQRELYYKSVEFCRRRPRSRPTNTQGQTQNTFQPTENSTINSQGGSQLNSSQRIQYSTAKLDETLNDICCLVGCSRVHLHILAQAKGLLYGDLKFQLKNGAKFDCLSNREGIQIPNSHVTITKIESNAKCIIVVEKDSVLQKILNQEPKTNFVKNYNVILMTAKGYPDLNSRVFLNFLWSKLSIPILVLTDADPHGAEIVCSYKFGCYRTAYEGPNAAVPQARWLGLLPSDVAKLSLPEQKLIPQTNLDRRKTSSLLSRPYLRDKPAWREQLELMRSSGKKAELESIDESGEFLVTTYLPNKLRYASWI